MSSRSSSRPRFQPTPPISSEPPNQTLKMSFSGFAGNTESQTGPRIYLLETWFYDTALHQRVLAVFRSKPDADAMLERIRSLDRIAAITMFVKSEPISDASKSEVFIAFDEDTGNGSFVSRVGATKEEIAQKAAKRWKKNVNELVWKDQNTIAHPDPNYKHGGGYFIERHAVRYTGHPTPAPNLFVVFERNLYYQDTVTGIFRSKEQAAAKLAKGKTIDDFREISIKEFHVSNPTSSKVFFGFEKGYDLELLTFAESTKEKLSFRMAAEWEESSGALKWLGEDTIANSPTFEETVIVIREFQIE